MKRIYKVYKKTVSIVNETSTGMYQNLVGNKKGFLLESYDKTRTKWVNDDNPYFQYIDENFKRATYKDVYDREPDLMKNYATLADAILKAKPSAAKGTYLKSVYLSTTISS